MFGSTSIQFWLASVELTRAAFDCKEEASMYFVAAVLAVLSGLFYAAGHHQIGSLGATMCQYGGHTGTWWHLLR